MRVTGELLVWACLIITSIAAHNVTRRETKGGSKRVVCYYTNWSVYRPGTAKFNPQNINPYLCTHLIYAFGGLTRENGLRPYDKYQDIEQGGYAKFTGLKTYNKQLKTMLAIGGWNEGSTRFSPLVASNERRAEFVKNVVRFLRQNHFDGLDLDWEYPAFRDGGKPRDRENYALLVQELREEFDRESSKTGRPRLLLTMAVPAGIEYIDKGYDIPKLNRYLDFMNILSYDYHSSFEPSVNHHSPLYPLEEEGEYNFDAQLSIDYTINHYLKLGADRDKLVLGIPTYGRSYTLFNPDSTEIGSPADGPGEQGDATREKGYLAYYEICENLESPEWKVVKPNPRAMGPYAYRGNQWVGYDDEDIVRKKARYVTEMQLGGIMYWAIDNDDFRGKCHGRPYPLIEAGKEAMLAGTGTANELDAPKRSKPRPKPRVTTEEPPISNSGGGSSTTSTGGGKRRRPSVKTKTHEKHASTTTSTTPAYSYPTSTPEPPTTPDPGSDFKCEDEGFFPHPRDCKKYFWCLDSGPSNLGIVAHQFTCPSGLYFNKAADSCDYTRNVVCNTKTTVEPATTTTTTRKPDSTTLRSIRTTSTTTEAPEEEEEYEDYEEEPEEDPKAIKELIDLIRKLGGIENLEKQLHLDESKEKVETKSAAPPAISKKLYDRVLSQANHRGNSNANFYNSPSSKSSTPHTLIFKSRGRQNEGLENIPEATVARQEKPQYVTIRRERPTKATPTEAEEEDEELEDEEAETEDEVPNKKQVKTSGREYVNIRRERPAKQAEEEVTTSKYVSIRRQKPAPVTEATEEKDSNDEIATVEEITTTAEPSTTTAAATQETPVFRKKLTAFTPRTPKTGSVLENFRRKKKEEVVAVTTVEEKDDFVTVTTETTTLKVSEASQKSGPSSLPYLEVTRGSGSRLSSTQSTLEDDLSNVNTYDASTSAPQLEGNNTPLFQPSVTSESTTEELTSPPLETDPPTTTSEPLPLSTTTQFTPTVTRVVTSESESGTTERHRISLSKYKGFLLTVSPSSQSLTTESPDGKSASKVEKIMEVNRITQVTFNDYFSVPFTRPINIKESTTRSYLDSNSNVNQGKTSVSPDDETRYTSTNPSETDSTIPVENLDNNEISLSGVKTEVDTTTQQVTPASSSSSTEGRSRFRQPFRGTSTRSPLPRGQRRRTTTSPTSLGSVTESSDQQVSTRKPFKPSRRGSYRPTSQTDSGDELRSSTVLQNEGAPVFARRTTTTTTVEPEKFVPEYRSRGRKKVVEVNTDDEQETPVNDQEEPELGEEQAVTEKNRDRPSLTFPRSRSRIVNPVQQEVAEQEENTSPETNSYTPSSSPPRSRVRLAKPVQQNLSEQGVSDQDDAINSELNINSPSPIPPRYRSRVNNPVQQEVPDQESPINQEISRIRPSSIPPRSRGRIVSPVQQDVYEQDEPVNTDTNTYTPRPILPRSRGRTASELNNAAKSQDESNKTQSRRPTSRFRISTTTVQPERAVNPQQRYRGRTRLITRTESVQDELVSEQTLPSQGTTILGAVSVTPGDTTIPSRTRGRVVKKIKKRPLNGTSTTSDPTTSQTTAPLSSSTVDDGQYESKKVGADGVTPLTPTDSYLDPSTLYTLDGVTEARTTFDEDLASTPSPYEDYGTTSYVDDQQYDTYAPQQYVAQDEVLETEFSSSSVEVSDRGTHKFSLGDVLLADNDDSVEPKLLKRLPPQTFKPRVPARSRQRNPQDTSYESYDSIQNSLGGSSEVSRDPSSKRRTVVKRRRLPDQLTSTSESEEVEAVSQGELPSTTSRTFLRRRPESGFYANNRVRSRSTTTTTTETPTLSARPGRRPQTPTSRLVSVNRRRKYGDANNSTSVAVVASPVQEVAATEPIANTLTTEEPDIITAEPGRKFSFPRRRTKLTNVNTNNDNSTNDNENNNNINADGSSTNKTIKLTVKAALRHVVDSQNEPSTVEGAQATVDDAQYAVDELPAPLPDLANDAVVAIHNLVTIPTRPSPRQKVYVDTSAPVAPTRPSPRQKVYVDTSATAAPTRPSPRQKIYVETSTPYIVPTATSPLPPRISTTAAPFFPRRGTAVYVSPTSTPAPVQRGRPFSKITSPQVYPQSGSAEAEFEYYDSGESIFSSNPITGKVKIHSDGYIECLDQGNFPHPFSCKKFISCAKMENNDVLGWEYTCPRHLSFDPIGGICNWSAGLGCKE